jgi:hypothetical protein
MDIASGIGKVLNTQKNTKRKLKKDCGDDKKKNDNKCVKLNNFEILDPENDYIEETLVKICKYLEYLKSEIKDIKEDIESKADLSCQNTLSLKTDSLETMIDNLSDKLDEIN